MIMNLIVHILHKDGDLGEFESHTIDGDQVQELRCTYPIKQDEEAIASADFEKKNDVEFLLSNGERINITATNQTFFTIYYDGKKVVETASQKKFEKVFLMAKANMEPSTIVESTAKS